MPKALPLNARTASSTSTCFGGAVQRAQDSANDVIDARDPLTADEQAAAASLPFTAPALERVDLTERDVDADLNQGLRTLLRQIDVDRKEITRGLGPINAVPAGVPFRNGSHLAIEPVDHLSSNLQEFSAPVDELAGLQIQPDAILIVENKEPALAWSDMAGLVVIHSLGNHLDVLSHLLWIRHDHCWYWGDLDRHGFTLLSRGRSMISRLRSLLMASGAIEAYRPLGVEEDLDRYDRPDSTLTLAEASALAALKLTGGKYLHRTRADSRQ